MKILLTAQDTESCAAFLGALGIRFEQDRHGAWHAALNAHLELRDGAGPFTASLAADDPAACAARLEAVGGTIEHGSGGPRGAAVHVLGPNGERLTLQRASAKPRLRPNIIDQSLLHLVAGWLRPNMDRLREVMAGVGAANPRILGPIALGGERGDDYTMIVDGDASVDLAPIEAFIADVNDGRVGLKVMLASALRADRREELEDIAWRW